MKKSFIMDMNRLGKEKKPFFFMIDFEWRNPTIIPIEETYKSGVLFAVDKIRNFDEQDFKPQKMKFLKYPINYLQYKESFDCVKSHIRYGNSFLVNLTFPTEINTNLTLDEIFHLSKAPFRLKVSDKFVVFSPERFVRISGREIFSYPMKGTIDSSIPGAGKIILEDAKELSEHYTIVDLIRNDLSVVAENVRVNKFRYVDEIKTQQKNLLQISSEISGLLPSDYNEHLGNIFDAILPAGSICGAPKKKTLEIIHQSEKGPRGFYTGVFGIFDGNDLDSAVMIRFIENSDGKLIFRSGGGITMLSDPGKEYQEMIDKVYLPIIN